MALASQTLFFYLEANREKMLDKKLKIEIYDKRREISARVLVTEIAANTFTACESELFDCRLSYGTEFETRINSAGKHEVVRILKTGDFITRRFFLNSQFTIADYLVLGDEITKNGGYWQVDFASLATISLPSDSQLGLDKIFEVFEFKPTEICD